MRLVLVEVDTLEVDSHKPFLYFFEILSYSDFLVLYEFLFHEAGFFEELVHTALGDVLYHLFGKVGGFCFGSLLSYGTGFVGFFLSEPALPWSFQQRRCIRSL